MRIQSEIRKNIYDSFQKHGLDLTIPQAQMNLDTENKGSEEKYRKERLGNLPGHLDVEVRGKSHSGNHLTD